MFFHVIRECTSVNDHSCIRVHWERTWGASARVWIDMATAHTDFKSERIEMGMMYNEEKEMSMDDDLFYDMLRRTRMNFYMLQENYDKLLSRWRNKYKTLEAELGNTKTELENTQEILSHFMDIQGRKEKRDAAIMNTRRHYTKENKRRGRIECDGEETDDESKTPKKDEDTVDNIVIPEW